MYKDKGMVINGGHVEKRMMRLGVRACKSEDEGMNLVFMTYADVCELEGREVQQDSLCVILEVTLLVALPITSHSSCCPCIPFLRHIDTTTTDEMMDRSRTFFLSE